MPSPPPPADAPQRRRLSPDEVRGLAAMLAQAGRLDEAEAAYRRVLAVRPDDAPAATALGLLLERRGKLEEARNWLACAAALLPQDAGAQNNLGRLALSTGQAQQALPHFEAALRLAPDQAEVHYNRAQALAALGRGAAAMEGWRAALALAPDLAPAHLKLGLALAAAGDAAAEAHLRRATAVMPPLPGAHTALARLLAARGDAAAANAAFAQALSLTPDDALLHNDAGAALAAAGAHEAALAMFNRAISLAPSLAAAHNNLGNALAALKRWEEAAQAYHAALALAPDFTEAHGNLGQVLLELRQVQEALPHFDAALTASPSCAEYHHGRGRTLVFLGDLPAALTAYEEAVRLAPDHPEYYTGLAYAHGLTADDPAFLALSGFAADIERRPQGVRIGWHFAMHRCLEHQGQHEEAFAHLVQGNKLRRPLIGYDEEKALNFLARLEAVFTAELLRRAPLVPPLPDVPIFILGMPRSGSTLVEQILASHSDVHGAGELPYLADSAATLDPGGLPFPGNVPARAPAELRAAGDAYRARLRALAPEAPRITDKMPANFMNAGLLRLILPGARIIHTRRDPVDTCLSCFAQIFGPGLPYANDLGELGRYYRAYERLMAHWRAVLSPGVMLEVDYEALVTDFEPQVRRILDFCGLGWDPACLAFHTHERPVITASAAQVRQKLYKHATGRAKPYGALLAPLLAALAG